MSASPLSTPCIDVCAIDPLSALCVGCGRTTAEIAAWITMSETERVAIMAGLGRRLTEARSRSVRGGRVGARGEKVEAGLSRKRARYLGNLEPSAIRPDRRGL
ncbi:MAG: DUF1289 domain-containing protein [Roseiarcus sp.]